MFKNYEQFTEFYVRMSKRFNTLLLVFIRQFKSNGKVSITISY